jgi:hypothetical protein
MEDITHESAKKRTVYPPQAPNDLPPLFASVEVAEDETVEWQWTYYADGRRRVTGYTVVRKPGEAE